MSNGDETKVPRMMIGSPEWREAMKDPAYVEELCGDLHQVVSQSVAAYKRFKRRKVRAAERAAREAGVPGKQVDQKKGG